jgi:ribosome-associated heat shock protein Hsp15
MNNDEVRVDKWLWAVRIYKTRSQAAEACKKGRVLIDGHPVKASRNIKKGDTVVVRKLPVIYTYKVTGLIEKRVSAKMAVENYEDLTSVEELNKLKISDDFFIKRDRGTGRPTKKERRTLDKIKKSLKQK